MKNRNILVVTEGPDDGAVIRKILTGYRIFSEHNIYEYKTNIYCFYDMLENETEGDWEQADIPLLLRAHEQSGEIKKRLSAKFSDIILIFDFDPQHTTYSYEKIKRLYEFFGDSQEYGKLYLDYPMIESVGHFKVFPNDKSYQNRMVTREVLENHKYKAIVNQDSGRLRGLLDLSKPDIVSNIIQSNLCQIKNILYGRFERVTTYGEYQGLPLEKVLKVQAEMYKKDHLFYVLCTCVLYIVDFDRKLFFAPDKPDAGGKTE